MSKNNDDGLRLELRNQSLDKKTVSRLLNLGFSRSEANEFIEKYGSSIANELSLKVALEPYPLANKLNLTEKKSRSVAKYLLKADVSDEAIADIVGCSEVKIKSTKVKDKAVREETFVPVVKKTSQPNVVNRKNYKTGRIGPNDATAEGDSTYVSLNDRLDFSLCEFDNLENVQRHVNAQASAEIKQLHEDHPGEFTLADLEKMGITLEDIAKVMKPEDMAHFHAGPMGVRFAQIMKKVDQEMQGSGHCLAGVQIGNQRLFAEFGDKFNYNPDQKHCSSNSACYSHQALAKEGYYVFRFDNKTGKDANPILGLLPAGATVNFDKNPNAGTGHGHICVADEYVQSGTGHFYSDTKQAEATIVSGIRGGSGSDVYGDSFYVSFLPDTTISDELLKKILIEKNWENYTECFNDINRQSLPEPVFRPATTVESDSIINVNNIQINPNFNMGRE